MNGLNVNTKQLENAAVDIRELSSNFADIAADCYGLDGKNIKSELQNRFPLATWLLGTSMSRQMRARATSGLINLHRETVTDESGSTTQWVLEVPGNIFTTLPTSTANECCWVVPDFDTCSGKVPLNLLCLKDCDSIFDSLVYDVQRIGARDVVPGIAYRGESMATVNRRIARLAMAFYTAQNVILGMDGTYTDTLKPFHGLLAVLENPAIVKINGSSILGAFDSLWCRLAVLGGASGYRIAVHPLTLSAIEKIARPGQDGRYPDGWSRVDGDVRFHGIRFIEDVNVPVDIAEGTGEAWVLHEDSIGLFLGTDLMVGDSFIKESGIDTSENNCGARCDYYYNFGAAFGRDAAKLAVIQDIPLDSNCTAYLGDLAGIIQPKTLIPGAVA